MMHGHHMDSEVWFAAKNMGKPLPLQLYDEGYDIWLGNNRGSNNCEHVPNRVSKENTKLVWNWSWAEMGQYDLPAFILKIKRVTKHQKVAYIGYGQGTTQMLYALSHFEKEFFTKHVSKTILLAPCVMMDMLNDGKNYAGYKNVFGSAEKGMVYHSGNSKWQNEMRRLICHKISVSYCMTYFLNAEAKIEYTDHLTQSIKTIAHFM